MHSVIKATVAVVVLLALTGCQSSPNIRIDASGSSVVTITNGAGEQDRGRQAVPVTNTGGIAGGMGGGAVTVPALPN